MKNTLTIAAIIIVGLLVVSITANQNPPSGATSSISMTSSDDGRNVYLSYTITKGANHKLVIFRSTDHGLIWRRVPSININWLGQTNTPDQK